MDELDDLINRGLRLKAGITAGYRDAVDVFLIDTLIYLLAEKREAKREENRKR